MLLLKVCQTRDPPDVALNHEPAVIAVEFLTTPRTMSVHKSSKQQSIRWATDLNLFVIANAILSWV